MGPHVSRHWGLNMPYFPQPGFGLISADRSTDVITMDLSAKTTGSFVLKAGDNSLAFNLYTEGFPLRYAAEVYSDNAADEAQLNIRRYRGTKALPTSLQADDEIASIFFSGYGGNGVGAAASIRAFADAEFGTAGDTSDRPGRMEFYTVPDGSATQMLAMVIKSTQYIGVGGITAPTAALHISAGTTTRAPLCLPHGAAPTSPVNGDIWTTTAGLFVRINGATVGPLS